MKHFTFSALIHPATTDSFAFTTDGAILARRTYSFSAADLESAFKEFCSIIHKSGALVERIISVQEETA